MDVIKREDAIKAVEEYDSHLRLICKRRYTKGHEAVVLDIVAILKSIPSAENKGEWIDMPRKMFKCSECGQIYQVLEPKNFCSNCGADMRKGVDNE